MKSRQDINMQFLNLDPYPESSSPYLIYLGYTEKETILKKDKSIKYTVLWYFNKFDGMIYAQNQYSEPFTVVGGLYFYQYGHIDMHILETIKDI
jgi:hypothetical protein